MQKKLIALAVAGLASTAAFAQTNVTIYGIVDMAGTYTDTQAAGKSQWNVSSGVLSTSRLGFKGVEDLGNGLKALFTLEYALAADINAPLGFSTTANATARQQFVGLTGGFGTVVAGHLQTTGLDFAVASSALGGSTGLGAFNVVGTGSSIATAAAKSVVNAGARASNAVAYISPSFGGVTLAYNHARLSEAALGTNTADNYANLLSASYAGGPVTAGLVYGKISMPGTVGSDDNTEWGVRAGYDFGVAKLQAAYQTSKDKAIGNGKDKKYVVSVSAPIGAKVGVIAEYAALSQDKTAAADDQKAWT
ncbi:MAG: porin, partial [Azonexus sp.]|nr:porin [Azonexus sp.]